MGTEAILTLKPFFFPTSFWVGVCLKRKNNEIIEQVEEEHEELWKTHSPRAIPLYCYQVDLKWGPGACVFTKLPGDVMHIEI